MAGAHKFTEGDYFLFPFRRVSRLRRPFVLRRPRRRASGSMHRQDIMAASAALLALLALNGALAVPRASGDDNAVTVTVDWTSGARP